MLRARSVAICAALLAVSSEAAAQSTGQGAAAAAAPPPPQPENGLTFRLRSLHSYAVESRGDTVTRDYWYGITPELLYLYRQPRWNFRATYGATGALHSDLPDEIAHRGGFSLGAELSRRTTATLGADAAYSTISNFLVLQPAYLTPVGTVPSTSIQILSVAAAEGVSWEASPVVRVDQRVDGTYLVTYQGNTEGRSELANAAVAVERYWRNDAIGAEVRGGYAFTDQPILNLKQKLVTASLQPRWRHDWTRALSSLLTAGATAIFSPDKDTKPTVTPSGRGTLMYDWETAHVEAAYGYGYEPNVLTGQLLKAHQATLLGTMPLSQSEHIGANATFGYLRGSFVDLRRDAPTPPDFDALRADLELTWTLRPTLQVIGRYQFLAQTSDAAGDNAPTLIRHAVVAGIQLTSSANGLLGAPRGGGPQRVDRRDSEGRDLRR